MNSINLNDYQLVLLPGFIQWDTSGLEKKYFINIRKGPEFASDIPIIINNLEEITLSNTIPANKLYEQSGIQHYHNAVDELINQVKNQMGPSIFYINKERSDIIIGGSLPPPIIAEIVNCTQKNDANILKKAKHYLDSGASIIDIGCVSNKPNPSRVKEIIRLLRQNFNTLISVDSMESSEILAAAEVGVDLVLSVDISNYKDLLTLPKDLTLVILPTNVKKGYFPKDPTERVNNLLELTKILRKLGFTKLIADPLLETPIAPGTCKSLETYFLYKKTIKTKKYSELEAPLFFGVSNVVELMDIDSIGINGLLASIAIEMGISILFTVEHSAKTMRGVRELKEGIKLCFLSKIKKVPPINLGIQYFQAKGKINPEIPEILEKKSIFVNQPLPDYIPDKKGYFKIYVNHYSNYIIVLFYSNQHELMASFVGEKAEIISKKIIELNLTNDIFHINYLGRELMKAEMCLLSGKPYLQDE